MSEMKIKIILICLFLFVVGCDGYLGVEGRAYEWIEANPIDNSFILVDKLDRVLPAELKPLKDVEIVIEPWSADKRPEDNKNAELWTQRIKTDKNGYFKTGSTAAPSKFNATISVRDPRFKKVEHIFYHDRLHHFVLIVLVREKKTV
jgi:hypothetical protein